VGETELHANACPECGTACPRGVKFCANCGIDLRELQNDGDELPAGTIMGSYRILDLLGEGGMGRVYVAEHIKLGRRVAVKMLRGEFAANPVAVSRFFAEARAVNRISHVNIVEITDFLDKSSGHNCYIMELLNGEDLGLRLLRAELMPIADSVEIGIQIASALSAVHAAGIIHRDLKPDNIFLIDRNGSRNFVKLLDFGVAKLVEPAGISLHTTAAGQIIGTPEYMSPEQGAGQAVDLRTDIYALGIILYELVTGELPFKAKSFGELILKHMTVPPRRPSSVPKLPHVVPPALDDLIIDLLAKSPDDRPQTMAEVESRLHDIHESLDLPVLPRRMATSGSIRVIKPNESGRVRRVSAPEATAPTLDAPGATPVPRPPLLPGAFGESARMASGAIADVQAPRRRVLPYALAIAGLAIAAIVAWVILRGDSTADPVAAATATPDAPPAPAAPAEVRLRFSSTPAGATVRIVGSDKTLGVTPFAITQPRGDTPLTVEFTKPGFQLVTDEIDLRSDGALAAALPALPTVATPDKPRPTKKPTPVKPARPTPEKPKPAKLDRGGTMDVLGGK
jgi:eukaryotic-like serine/threonine-protein kinase